MNHELGTLFLGYTDLHHGYVYPFGDTEMKTLKEIFEAVEKGEITAKQAVTKAKLIRKCRPRNKTFPYMKVKYRFGDGFKQNYTPRMAKPWMWERLQKYGI